MKRVYEFGFIECILLCLLMKLEKDTEIAYAHVFSHTQNSESWKSLPPGPRIQYQPYFEMEYFYTFINLSKRFILCARRGVPSSYAWVCGDYPRDYEMTRRVRSVNLTTIPYSTRQTRQGRRAQKYFHVPSGNVTVKKY